MDITPEYIRMCEKAEEIQERWKASAFDVVYWEWEESRKRFRAVLEGGKDYLITLASPDMVYISQQWDSVEGEKIGVWLPRQDQLQDVVRMSDLFILEALFHNFCYKQTFTSFEQLWLAFVMKEKYGKVWNGEEWAKA